MQSTAHKQNGFTLMEIIVATGIFAATVTLSLGLFTQALKINRRVQALRLVAQNTRNFTEVIVREIRNGRIDYDSFDANCTSANYATATNQAVGVISFAGDQECLHYNLSQQTLYLSKKTGGSVVEEPINDPLKFKIKPNSFRLVIRPVTDPALAPYNETQPLVTLIAEFEVPLGAGEQPMTIPYQTTISTDVYDLPSAP
jgi:prepilin-type N-terminal cleavage/methylation domain-containing protein